MRIIVAGIIGRYPYGGVAWCSLMYLLGLRDLGHDVWYLEDTGEANYDPAANTLAVTPHYALTFIHQCLAPYHFGDRWCYIDYHGNYHGHTRESWLGVCADTDLFLNLSGGCWFWRDEYAAIPHTAFIDSDPAFTQLALAKGERWYVEFFSQYHTLFTFGSNIGTTVCAVPTEPFVWEHTWQPVSMDEWRSPVGGIRPFYTTVMTWQTESFLDIGGNKDIEFMKIIDLPSRVDTPIELAVSGPLELLRSYGWRCRDAFPVSSSLSVYRDYLQTSRGEFSVAKHTYVSTESGWFSDRTECYLASGRPAIVQDTGFSAHLPVGDGLFAYRTVDEACECLRAVESDYPRHARTAKEIARAYFAAEVVLPPLLERATAGSRSAGRMAPDAVNTTPQDGVIPRERPE